MNTEDYREQLTRDIYEAMQKPYLSERHDAILSLIQEAEHNARIEELDRTINIIWGTAEHPNHQLLKMTKSRLEELNKGGEK